MKAGIGLVPEDRRQQGLVMELSHRAQHRPHPPAGAAQQLGVIGAGSEGKLASRLGDQLQLKFHSSATPSASCRAATSRRSCSASGSRPSPKVLIIDEPTRGIDVGTKAEVHRLMSELAGQGLAVLMISSELPEVLGMADRVLVMHEGRIARELSRDEADEESVVRAATGQAGGGVSAQTPERSAAGPAAAARRAALHRRRSSASAS